MNHGHGWAALDSLRHGRAVARVGKAADNLGLQRSDLLQPSAAYNPGAMLRITQQNSAKGAKAYYAVADYYSEGQEIIGAWGGAGARQLGLTGVVDQQSFERLCDNLDPRDGKPLTVRTRTDRTVGYDFTFSVPKSVSLLYGMTGDKEILSAFRAAVDETMREIESEMKTRVRRFNKDTDRETGNAVWAEFIHTTARPIVGVPDPQLHAHCFVFNSTWDQEERRWKAGQFRGLKADAPYFQAAFRVRLAGKLQDMGLAIIRKRDDFEIEGISAATLKKFSRRTEQIEKVAAELGITDPERKAELGATTREKKDKRLSHKELQRDWKGRLGEQELKALATAYRRQGPKAQQVGGEKEAVDHSLAHSFLREPSVAERKLVTEALKRGLGSVTVEGVQRELARRPLIRAEVDGRTVVTTPEMKAIEDRLVRYAREGRGRLLPICSPDRPFSCRWLNEGQKAAVRHVLSESRDFITMVRGAPGTGKTTLEEEINKALAERHVPVAALAPSTTAVDELRDKAGFTGAATIAHFLRDTRMQQGIRSGVMLIDEASMVGSRDMLRLFEIARQQQARIVLVGDKRQHRSVSAGEPLRQLEEAGVPVCEVSQIIRQEHGDYRKAAEALTEGRTADGFAELDKLGWIREIPHAGRYWSMAQGYLSTVLEKNRKGESKTALCISPTHAEGARVTNFIRGALKAEGKLKDERTLATWIPARLTDPQKADATQYEPGDLLQFHQLAPGHKNGSRLIVREGTSLPLAYADRFEVYRPAQLSLAVGDRVRVTVNGWTKDGKHKLNNGALYSVRGWTEQGDPVIDHGWVIDKSFGHLSLGYCVTSHVAEGRTVDKVFIAMGSQSFGATNQRSFLVPVTRGRAQAVIFTDSKEQLLRAAQRPDQPLSATEVARRARRKPALAQRLKRHLANMRRRAYLAFAHERPAPESQRSHEPERDYGYGR